LYHLWRRNVAVFAPAPKRCRLPGKRCRFEASTSLLIVETSFRLVTLALSPVGIMLADPTILVPASLQSA
jgi:hypothetical protein